MSDVSVRDGIAPDVWETASSIAMRRPEPGALFSENYVLPLARAIMAERERCAAVADEQAGSEEYGHAKHACVMIAQTIREPSP